MSSNVLQREFAFKVSGGRFALFVEDASQTYKHGDSVKLVSNKVQALLASGAEHLNTTGAKLLGIALRDASNRAAALTNADMPVWVVTTDTIARLPIWSATPANAEKQDVVLGTPQALRNQGGILCVSMDTTTNGTCIPYQFDSDYGATDQYVSIQIKFDPASLLFKS